MDLLLRRGGGARGGDVTLEHVTPPPYHLCTIAQIRTRVTMEMSSHARIFQVNFQTVNPDLSRQHPSCLSIEYV